MARQDEARKVLEKNLRKIAMEDCIHGWGNGRDAEAKMRQKAKDIVKNARREGLSAGDVLATWDALAAGTVEGFESFREVLAELAAQNWRVQ